MKGFVIELCFFLILGTLVWSQDIRECGRSNNVKRSCGQTWDGFKGPAFLGMFPWHAVVYSGNEIVCDAVKISNKHFLTTASCMKRQGDNDLKVAIGSVHFDHIKNTIFSKIKWIEFHPKYHNGGTRPLNDLVVFASAVSFELTYKVRPACLPFLSINDTNIISLSGHSLFTGRGDTSTNGLKYKGFQVDIKEIDACSGDQSFCTDYKDIHLSKSYGGPAVLSDGWRCDIVGLLSYKMTYQNRDYLVFTHIYYYVEWIQEMMRK